MAGYDLFERRAAMLFLLIGFLFVVACNAIVPASPARPLPATPTPISLSRVDSNAGGGPRYTPDCTILITNDVAAISSGEVVGPIHGSGRAERVIFAPEAASTQETYCVYQGFYRSGSAQGKFYQVTYWVDKPADAAPSEWAQVWTDARSKSGQPLSGIGDDAFYQDGRLTFKKGTTYVTIEVQSTTFDPKTTEGQGAQLDLEKKLAQKALVRMAEQTPTP